VCVRAAWTCAREALASGTGSNSAKTYTHKKKGENEKIRSELFSN